MKIFFVNLTKIFCKNINRIKDLTNHLWEITDFEGHIQKGIILKILKFEAFPPWSKTLTIQSVKK
jgi:hypothetical protein